MDAHGLTMIERVCVDVLFFFSQQDVLLTLTLDAGETTVRLTIKSINWSYFTMQERA
jgi:hypothetical protein